MADRVPRLSDDLVFPRRAENRPGLDRIAYRIGRYPEFREQMLRLIDSAPALAAWTHREPDDPGIALIESAAIVGDILAFYQELYANEAYLRSIAWRESVAERLVTSVSLRSIASSGAMSSRSGRATTRTR